jgi:hypothetical protein
MKLMHVCSKCRTEWEAEGVPTKEDICPACSPEFHEFKKIPRLSREIIITEKIDGTNGLIYINENLDIFAGSRNKWLDDHHDNFGFWHWAMQNKEELKELGSGYHYGEWWGNGIQRNYGLKEKRFSIFNVGKWLKEDDDNARVLIELKDKEQFCPRCCYVVPILYTGIFDTTVIEGQLNILKYYGSKASPGFMNPEGVVIYHIKGNIYFKKTILNDEKPKNE